MSTRRHAAGIDRIRGRRRGPVPRQSPVGRPLQRLGFRPRGPALSERLETMFKWPKGAVEYPIDLALPRGVVIRGKVTEEGSGKPVAGARISFGSRRTQAQARRGLQWPARRAGRTARFSSRSCPVRAISSSWAPARITCSRRSASGWISRGKAGRPPLLRPRLHRLRPEAGQREPGRQRRAPPGHRP